MVANLDGRDKQPRPLQPRGWPLYAHLNVAIQARAQADAQRRRADRLAARTRRLRVITSGALAILGTVSVVVFALGLLFGFALGTGLIAVVGR